MSKPIQFLNNPGKYDTICSAVREAVAADGVIVIVLNGAAGSGCSVQGVGLTTMLQLADAVEAVAKGLRDMHAKGAGSD